MNKILAVILVAGLAAVGGWLVFGNTGNDKAPSSTSTTQSDQLAPQQTDKVTIDDMAFNPARISVKKGTTVTWTNRDSVAHNVNETDGKAGPASSLLSTGDSYSFTYNQAGSFEYFCSIHPQMTGTVIVTE